jgi:hypothetical protein
VRAGGRQVRVALDVWQTRRVGVLPDAVRRHESVHDHQRPVALQSPDGRSGVRRQPRELLRRVHGLGVRAGRALDDLDDLDLEHGPARDHHDHAVSLRTTIPVPLRHVFRWRLPAERDVHQHVRRRKSALRLRADAGLRRSSAGLRRRVSGRHDVRFGRDELLRLSGNLRHHDHTDVRQHDDYDVEHLARPLLLRRRERAVRPLAGLQLPCVVRRRAVPADLCPLDAHDPL